MPEQTGAGAGKFGGKVEVAMPDRARMTAEEEAYIREIAAAEWKGGNRWACGLLLAEIDYLREQVKGHCERIAKQSELLSRKAEGRTNDE